MAHAWETLTTPLLSLASPCPAPAQPLPVSQPKPRRLSPAALAARRPVSSRLPSRSQQGLRDDVPQRGGRTQRPDGCVQPTSAATSAATATASPSRDPPPALQVWTTTTSRFSTTGDAPW